MWVTVFSWRLYYVAVLQKYFEPLFHNDMHECVIAVGDVNTVVLGLGSD